MLTVKRLWAARATKTALAIAMNAKAAVNVQAAAVAQAVAAARTVADDQVAVATTSMMTEKQPRLKDA